MYDTTAEALRRATLAKYEGRLDYLLGKVDRVTPHEHKAIALEAIASAMEVMNILRYLDNGGEIGLIPVPRE